MADNNNRRPPSPLVRNILMWAGILLALVLLVQLFQGISIFMSVFDVHINRAPIVRAHDDQALAGRRPAFRRRGAVIHACRADVVREHLAQLVIGNPPHERGPAAQRRNPRAAVRGGSAGNLAARPHLRIEVRRLRR